MSGAEIRSRYQAHSDNDSSKFSSQDRVALPKTLKNEAKAQDLACSPRNLFVLVLLSALFTVCIGLVAHFDGVLPAPRGLDAPLDEYCESRARIHLDKIVGFGVRTVGSAANEVNTVNYLLQEVKGLQQEAADVSAERTHSGSSHQAVNMFVDVHRPSGAFSSNFLEGFTNIYHNVSNVVVLIEGTAPAAEQRSILVNAHFDTALGTAAASDDAVMIASMLELMRNLIHGPRLRHSVIFNMNGAEETNWMAAHGFITQHRWKHKIRAMVNLEGAGAGGRELIIQTGPSHSWVAQAYANHAPWPHGHTLAQNVFQSGVIPGDTDFQVYRDYGGESIEEIDFLPGIDLVAISKGHVYHTLLDDIDHIDRGALQRTGENVLAILHALGNSKYLTDPGPNADEEVIFFDILGVWMIVYTEQTALVLNAAVLGCLALFVLFSPITRDKRRLLVSVTGAAMAFFAGPLACLVVGGMLTAIDQPMKWYASPRAGYTLYGCTAVLGSLVVRTVLHKLVSKPTATKHPKLMSASGETSGKMMRDPRLQQSADEYPFFGSLVMWGLLLGFAMRAGVESAYICVLSIIFPLGLRVLALLFSNALGPKLNSSFSRRMFLVVLGLVPPTVLLGQYVLELAQFIFPLMGRIGTDVAPDIAVAVTFGSVVSLLIQTPLSLIHEAASPQLHRRLLYFFSVVVVALMVYAVVVMDSYDDAHPKRMYYQHTRREWYSNVSMNQHHRDCAENDRQCDLTPSTVDAGLFVNGIDFSNLQYFASKKDTDRPEASKSVATIAAADPVLCNDEHGMLCSMPFYFPIDKMVQGGMYIPAADPIDTIVQETQPLGPQAPLRVKLMRAHVDDLLVPGDGLRRTFSIKVEGPDHIVMVVRANTLGSPASAHAAGIDLSILGGGRHPRNGSRIDHATASPKKSYWALDDWSFGKEEYVDGAHTQHYDAPATPMYRPDCNCYFVFRASGEDHHEPWQFDLTFAKTASTHDTDETPPEAVIDLIVYGQLLEAHSPELNDFVANMPPWTTPVSWVSHWQQHYLDLLDVNGIASKD